MRGCYEEPENTSAVLNAVDVAKDINVEQQFEDISLHSRVSELENTSAVLDELDVAKDENVEQQFEDISLQSCVYSCSNDVNIKQLSEEITTVADVCDVFVVSVNTTSKDESEESFSKQISSKFL